MIKDLPLSNCYPEPESSKFVPIFRFDIEKLIHLCLVVKCSASVLENWFLD